MNNLFDSLLSILLAPVTVTCTIVSGVANNIDLGVARKYSHEWTIKRLGATRVKEDLRSHTRYMLYQAFVLDMVVKCSFNDIIIYARPCAHEKQALEVEKIAADYDRKWAARSASREFQDWTTHQLLDKKSMNELQSSLFRLSLLHVKLLSDIGLAGIAAGTFVLKGAGKAGN